MVGKQKSSGQKLPTGRQENLSFTRYRRNEDDHEDERQINLLDHCIFCLRKTTEEKEVLSKKKQSDNVVEMLQTVPRATFPSSSASLLLSTFNQLWPYPQQRNEGDNLFGFAESNVPNRTRLNQLPTMCQFCGNCLETVHKLYTEVMKEVKKLASIIEDSKFGAKYEWRAVNFERTLKGSSLERETIQATLDFLGKLGKENILKEDSCSEETLPTNQLDPLLEQPITTCQNDCHDNLPKTLSLARYDHSEPEGYISAVSGPQSVPPDPLGNCLGNEFENEGTDEDDSDPDYIKSEKEDASSTSSYIDEDDEYFDMQLDEDELGEDLESGSAASIPRNKRKSRRANASEFIAETIDDSTGTVTYTCTLDGCGRAYKHKSNLQHHQLIQHKLNGDKSVVCNLCGKRITQRKNLPKHMKSVHGSESDNKKKSRDTHKCDLCKLTVPKKEVYEHVRAHVGAEYVVKCPNPQCFYVATQTYSVTNHLNGCKSCRDCVPGAGKSLKVTHVCEVCGYVAGNNTVTFQAHLLQKHENGTEKNMPCPISGCQRRFTVRQSVVLHLPHHDFCRDVTSQRCVLCSKRYKVDEMEAHLTSEHQVAEIIKCNQCSFLFSSRVQLLEHLIHHRYGDLLCDICNDGVKFSRHSQLGDHYFTVHKIGVKYFCEHCDIETAFSTKKTLLDHIKRKHKNAAEKDATNVSPEEEKAVFKCDHCDDVVYTVEQSIIDHNIKFHGAEPLKCKFCCETFVSRPKLKNHEREHRGVMFLSKTHGEFTCGVEGCGKIFKEKRYLRKHHSVTHLKIKSHVCEHCGKLYSDSGKLKDHMKATHLGLRPYICDICGDKFTDRTGLKRHKLIHAGVKAFVCDICGREFLLNSTLKKHLASHERKLKRQAEKKPKPKKKPTPKKKPVVRDKKKKVKRRKRSQHRS